MMNRHEPLPIQIHPYVNADALDPNCGLQEGMDYESGTVLFFVPDDDGQPTLLLQEQGLNVPLEALRYVRELAALAAHPDVQQALRSYETQRDAQDQAQWAPRLTLDQGMRVAA